MIRWIQKIKSLFNLADRLSVIESELNELETKLQLAVNQYSKDFEKKIQKMAFDYTKNLDDTKSDYLKRYVEVRMDCMQKELSQIPITILNEQEKYNFLTNRVLELEKKD